ncbi:MAG: pentapeptide repeat-containing protein, partial [Pseudoprimorskyibacter sp.]|nr:pentapeptide repeat-containing protein [Pseudoprimorskyibacter sp.]
DPRRPDLHAADLRTLNLAGRNLSHMTLNNAQMQDADLNEAQIQGADLSNTQMQHAILNNAQMQGAMLVGAQMQGADLSGAQMQGADLQRAVFDAQTDISLSYFQGANFRGADVSQTPKIADHLDQIFGDASNGRYRTRLPDGVDPPAHWPRDDLSAWDYKTAWRDWQKNTLRMAPDGSDIP